MIWTIAKKEFYSHLLTFRLWTGAVLCFIIVPFVLQVSLKRYQERLENYIQVVQQFDKEVRAVPTYSFVRPTVVRSPQVLSIMCSGIEENVGDEIQIRLGQVPFLPTGKVYGQDNPFLATFTSIDMTFVILFVVSLFSLLLTYDAVSGEKEDGILRLMFTNHLSRRQVITAKYLGALLVIIPFLVCLFAIALLMMSFSPVVHLALVDSIGTAILFLIACVYESVFLLLGLFISTRTGTSAVSLMFSIFIWVMIVVVIPNGGFHLSGEISKIPSMKDINGTLEKIDNDRDKNFDQIQTKQPDDAISLINLHYEQRPDNGIWIAGNSRESYDYITNVAASYDRLLVQYANRKEEVQKEYFDALLRQKDITLRCLILSPASLFTSASASVADVGSESFLHFLDNARTYRSGFISYLKEKHQMYPYRYISPDDDRVIKPAKEWIAYWTNGKYKSYNELFANRTSDEWRKAFFQVFDTTGKMAFLDQRNFQPLDLSDMPAFQYVPLSTGERVADSLYQMLILIGMNLFLFFVSHQSFVMYDVR